MLLSNMVICRFNFMFHHCPWSLVKLFKLASMWGNVQYKSCCYYHGNEKISFRKKKVTFMYGSFSEFDHAYHTSFAFSLNVISTF